MRVHSAISICNTALAYVGAQPIRDFLEDDKRSRMCDIFYTNSLLYCLNKHDWAFARKYQKLNQVIVQKSDEDNVPAGLCVYELPSDCLTPRNIVPGGSRSNWQIMGTKLYTKQQEVGLYYTHSETRPEEFSDSFVRLLDLDISVKLAGALAEDPQMQSSLYAQYKKEAPESYGEDSNIGNIYRDQNEQPFNDTFVDPFINDYS